MNIYITGNSFIESARNLDNVTLKAQTTCLAQIVNNITIKNKLYIDILEEAFFIRNFNEFSSIFNPTINSNHKTVTWASQSHIHFLFVCQYLHACINALIRRRYPLSNSTDKVLRISSVLLSYFGNILPYNITNIALYGLKDELYRSFPDEYKDNKDTIQCYQHYLLSKWKEQTKVHHIYQKELTKRTKLNYEQRSKLKPLRMVRPVGWRNEFTYPLFGNDELQAYKKELEKNATPTPAVAAATNLFGT